MAILGMSMPRIAAITGHVFDSCQKIIDTYLPRRPQVALAAIEQWENAPAPTALAIVVRLASRQRRGSSNG